MILASPAHVQWIQNAPKPRYATIIRPVAGTIVTGMYEREISHQLFDLPVAADIHNVNFDPIMLLLLNSSSEYHFNRQSH